MSKIKNQTRKVTRVNQGEASRNLRNFDRNIIDNLRKNRKAGF